MDLLHLMNHRRVVVIFPLVVGVITAIILASIQDPVYGVDGNLIGYKVALDPHIIGIYSVLAWIIASAVVTFIYWLIERCHEWIRHTDQAQR